MPSADCKCLPGGETGPKSIWVTLRHEVNRSRSMCETFLCWGTVSTYDNNSSHNNTQNNEQTNSYWLQILKNKNDLKCTSISNNRRELHHFVTEFTLTLSYHRNVIKPLKLTTFILQASTLCFVIKWYAIISSGLSKCA